MSFVVLNGKKIQLSTTYIHYGLNRVPLKYLQLRDMGVNSIDEVEGLSELKEIKYLDLSRNSISNLNGFEKLVNLRWLSLGNRISEIKGIRHLTNLTHLCLGNEISEIKESHNFLGLSFYIFSLADIQIKNCTMNQKLALINCHNLKIFDSTIPLLSFIRCFENHLKNCSIDKINNHFSKGNIFEQIDTPISDFDTIFGIPTSIFYGQSLGFGIVGIITIIAAIYLAINSSYNSSPDYLIWLVGGLLILGFGVLAGAIIMLIDKYKMKNYTSNKIL